MIFLRMGFVRALPYMSAYTERIVDFIIHSSIRDDSMRHE